jgi:hypothetical protein
MRRTHSNDSARMSIRSGGSINLKQYQCKLCCGK